MKKKIPGGFFPHWFSPQTQLRKLPSRTPASKGLVLPDSHTLNAPFHFWRRQVGDISLGFRRLYWKVQVKFTTGEFRSPVSASACYQVVCKFPPIGLWRHPRDEIHLLCLLIKNKPMKLTSCYCFTCDAEGTFLFSLLGR